MCSSGSCFLDNWWQENLILSTQVWKTLLKFYFTFQELKEAVESQIIKVMVVRKGQLKLYAGQSLPEVEMALRSILEQNLNANRNLMYYNDN